MNQSNPGLFASTPFDRLVASMILTAALSVPFLTMGQTAGLIR